MIGISQKLPQWCTVPPNSSAPHLAYFFSSVSFNTSFLSPTPPNFFATGQIVEPTFCAYVIPSSSLSHAVSVAQFAFEIEMSPIFFFDEMKKCCPLGRVGPLQYEFTWHLHVTWLSARDHCWNWDHKLSQARFIIPPVFYRPLQAGRSRTHFVTKSLSKTQMSHLEAQDAKSVQSKDV